MVRDVEVHPGTLVIEIGCGMGHLTNVLLDAGCRVLACEMDERLAECAARHFGEDAEVIRADIRSVDLCEWFSGEEIGAIVGNLPYSSAMTILFYLLDWHSSCPVWALWLQREVADRIRAKPGTSRYGRLSVMLQYLFDISALRRIGPSVFFPKPRVESVWIRLIPKSGVDYRLAKDWIEPLVKSAFTYRRKRLVANLDGSSLRGRRLAKETIVKVLEEVGLSPDCRAQDVSPQQFAELALALRVRGP